MAKQSKAKTILVTGATGGMGSACALLAAGRGYNLLLADLDADKLQGLAGECGSRGAPAECQVLDVADSGAIKEFVDRVQDRGGVDAVIHAVGVSPHMAAWDRIVQVDLIGTVELMEGLRGVIEPGGCAVCISSMSAHMVPPNEAVDTLLADPLASGLLQALEALPDKPLAHSGMAYAYAKRALLHYVVAGAFEWGREGKRLVSISPGLIDTDMGRLEADSDKEAYAAMRPMVALQRDGLPGEIASAALFLASEEASYISGCDLLVDGGFVAAFRNSAGQSR